MAARMTQGNIVGQQASVGMHMVVHYQHLLELAATFDLNFELADFHTVPFLKDNHEQKLDSWSEIGLMYYSIQANHENAI